MSQAEALVGLLRDRGVERLFGVPGGGSSLDLIEAAVACGLHFVLTRSETAAALMAATTAEISGGPGVVLTGLGPGTAAVVNGVAHAALDRTPVVVITDAHPPGTESHVSHQRLDQRALLAPLVKGSLAVAATTTAAELAALVDLASTPPRGPVHIQLDARTAALPSVGDVERLAAGTIAASIAPSGALPRAGDAERRAGATRVESDAPSVARSDAGDRERQVTRARSLLAAASQPVLLIGLEAIGAPEAARALAAHLGAPVLTTWKAKGVVPSNDALVVGLITGGLAEAACLDEADLIVQLGFDPIELIPGPWPYRAPIIDIAECRRTAAPAEPAVSIVGRLADGVARLLEVALRSCWPVAEVARHRERIAGRQTMSPVAGIGPQTVVEAAVELAPAGARAAIDAGAHMFPAIAAWPAARPSDVLISNGLATMGFALPAAIAAALAQPERRVVAFSGDGGLQMVLGELATAAELAVPVVVVVINDAALSLIAIKQTARGLPTRGSISRPVDFVKVAEGLGVPAWRVRRKAELRPALRAAFAEGGPALVDVAVDSSGYPGLLRAVRG